MSILLSLGKVVSLPAVVVGWRPGRRVPGRLPFRKVLRRPQFWFGLAVLLPSLAWFGYVAFWPIVRGLWLSLDHYQPVNPSMSRFAGFSNFNLLFTDPTFWTAVKNTLEYAFLVYAVSIPLGLLLAWAITTVKRGSRVYPFIVFLPPVVSLVAVSLLFRMLMDPQSGVFNEMLRALHLPTSQWIFGPGSALYSVVLVAVWQGVGISVLLFAAAMIAVSGSLYEAARVDGANTWQLFRHVTVPGIKPTITLVSVLTLIGGLQVYATPVVLGPGPGNSTLMLNQFIVEQFQSFNLGLACAAAVCLFAMVLLLTLIQLRILRRG